MLNILRKREVAKRIFYVLAAVVIFAFVFWGIPRGGRGKGPAFAGTVFGRKIAFGEFADAYEAVKHEAIMRYGSIDKVPDKLALKDQAWERIMLLKEAERRGIRVNDGELIKHIQGFPFWQRDGRFDPAIYGQIVTSALGMEPRDFEEEMRDALKIQKMVQTVMTNVRVADEEVLKSYKKEKEKVKVEYVFKPINDYLKDAAVNDEQLKAYYETHKDEFAQPRRVKVRYLEFAGKGFEARIEVTEEDIKYYYDTHKSEFEKPERVKARHILVDKEEDAKRLLDEVRKDPAKFPELAGEFSKCPSKANGGDLGFFERGKMVPEFEAAAFALKPGEISGVVKTSFGYHIITVDEREAPQTETLDEAREKVASDLRADGGRVKAYDEGIRVSSMINDPSDFDAAAKRENLSIKESEYFPEQGFVPGIGWSPEMQRTAFRMKKGDVSELISPDGYNSPVSYIIQLVDDKPAGIQPFEEARMKAEQSARKEAAAKSAAVAMEAVRRPIGEAMKSGVAFSDAARSVGLEPVESDYITRADYIDKIGQVESINGIFDLEPGTLSPVLSTKIAAALAVVKEKVGIDEKVFEAEKAEYKKGYIQKQAGENVNAWFEELKKSADIKSNI